MPLVENCLVELIEVLQTLMLETGCWMVSIENSVGLGFCFLSCLWILWCVKLLDTLGSEIIFKVTRLAVRRVIYNWHYQGSEDHITDIKCLISSGSHLYPDGREN